MPNIPSIPLSKNIYHWIPLVGPSLFVILGLLGFLPFRWLQPNHLLFGLLATATLINFSFLTLGIFWFNQLYPYQGHVFIFKKQLYQDVGIWFAILAIGGFVSLPIWPHLWLNLFTNSITSDGLYAIIGSVGLIKGFWGTPNAAATVSSTPSGLNIIPPQSSNQQQI